MDNSTDSFLFVGIEEHNLLSIFCKRDVYFEK